MQHLSGTSLFANVPFMGFYDLKEMSSLNH